MFVSPSSGSPAKSGQVIQVWLSGHWHNNRRDVRSSPSRSPAWPARCTKAGGVQAGNTARAGNNWLPRHADKDTKDTDTYNNIPQQHHRSPSPSTSPTPTDRFKIVTIRWHLARHVYRSPVYKMPSKIAKGWHHLVYVHSKSPEKRTITITSPSSTLPCHATAIYVQRSRCLFKNRRCPPCSSARCSLYKMFKNSTVRQDKR